MSRFRVGDTLTQALRSAVGDTGGPGLIPAGHLLSTLRRDPDALSACPSPSSQDWDACPSTRPPAYLQYHMEPKTAGCGALIALPTKLSINPTLSSRQGVHLEGPCSAIPSNAHRDGHTEPVELSQALDHRAAVRHTASLRSIALRSRQLYSFHIHSIVESSDLRDVGDCTTGTRFPFFSSRSTRVVRCHDSDVPAKVPAGANYGGVRSEKGVKSNP